MKLDGSWAESEVCRKIKVETDRAREVALRVLKEVNRDGRYANISLKDNLKKYSLKGLDAAFVTHLVYGTLEKQITLEWLIGKFARLKKINPWVKNILLLGAYQIMFMDRVPDWAACNESVKLCKKFCPGRFEGFVNAVLRNISRKKAGDIFPGEDGDPAEYLSVTCSYPDWLVRKWICDYGLKTARLIVAPFPREDYTTVRINTLKVSREQFIRFAKEAGLKYREDTCFPEALKIGDQGDIESNPLYLKGFMMVQDESSMLVVHVLDPQRGENVLDACSAPGGKTTHIAQRMGGEGRILAWDIHPHRVDLVKKNVARMGANIIDAAVHDARVYVAGLEKSMDRVLIDAPCSGLGVVHKKPDIKIRLKEKDLKTLPDVQWDILSTCSRYVRPGGVLVYSTCTINPDENEKLIGRFVEAFPDFYLEDFSSLLPDRLKDSVIAEGMLQLVPSRDGMDGFFISKLRRKG